MPNDSNLPTHESVQKPEAPETESQRARSNKLGSCWQAATACLRCLKVIPAGLFYLLGTLLVSVGVVGAAAAVAATITSPIALGGIQIYMAFFMLDESKLLDEGNEKLAMYERGVVMMASGWVLMIMFAVVIAVVQGHSKKRTSEQEQEQA